MKKAMSFLITLLFCLTIITPVGTVLAFCLGYDFKIVNIYAFVVIIAVVSVVTVVLDLVTRFTPEIISVRGMLYSLLPLSIINTAFCVAYYPRIITVVGLGVSLVSCIVLAIAHTKDFSVKILVLVLSVLLFLTVGFFSLLALLFGNFSKDTVVRSVESPSGKYYAEVIDNDQGGLGGATVVKVYRKGELNLLLFKISKIPQRVYLGRCGEFANMSVSWRDDGCLMIDSVPYEIK